MFIWGAQVIFLLERGRGSHSFRNLWAIKNDLPWGEKFSSCFLFSSSKEEEVQFFGIVVARGRGWIKNRT